jgi:hypothetical protein
MIVVATHDDPFFLNLAIENLNNINLNGHQILIIDTNSTNKEFLNIFEKLKKEYDHFTFKRLKYTCWDSGAYIYAFTKFKCEKYIFLQDSIKITNQNYIVDIDSHLENFDVVAHFPFGYGYDDSDQRIFVESDIHFNSLPNLGIFGPIFSANRGILEKIPKKWLKYPTNKNQGCGMERRWSLIFHSLGATKIYLEMGNDCKSTKYIEKYSPYRL